MNRMDRIFAEMRQKNDKILVSYFPIGDTIFDDDVEWAGKYFDNGTTVLEIGLPYDNPILDGKVVKNSMTRALKNKNLDQVFSTIKQMRKKYPKNILQIMTYYGNIAKYGIEKFAWLCNDCGVDAILAPDAPFDKFEEIDKALKPYNIYYLRFAPFHLDEKVISDLKYNAKGYIFLQAVDGATGPQKTVSPQIGINVKILKDAGIKTPVVAGFGISNPKQVKEVIDMGADGVIVGSSIVKSIITGNGQEFIKELKAATK